MAHVLASVWAIGAFHGLSWTFHCLSLPFTAFQLFHCLSLAFHCLVDAFQHVSSMAQMSELRCRVSYVIGSCE